MKIYPNEFYEYLTFQLVFDQLRFLVDETEDIRREERNQVGFIPKDFLIKASFIIFLIFLHASADVVIHKFLVVVDKMWHQNLHFWFKIDQISRIKPCPWQ